MPYKKLGFFSVFEKKLSIETEKNPIFVYPGLLYARKQLNFACKKFGFNFVRLSVQKKQNKIMGQFQNIIENCLLSPSKKAINTID